MPDHEVPNAQDLFSAAEAQRKPFIVAIAGSGLDSAMGVAGWSWYVSEQRWAAGAIQEGTASTAALHALVAAVKAAPRDVPLQIITNNGSVLRACTMWMRAWNSRKRPGDKPVPNAGLIRELNKYLSLRSGSIKFSLVQKEHETNYLLASNFALSAVTAANSSAPIDHGPGWPSR